MNAECIAHQPHDIDAWICLCGNTVSGAGFYSCDEQGEQMEATVESDWNDLYVCDRCSRIIDQKTLAIVGRRAAI